jgi:hypothetical protein
MSKNNPEHQPMRETTLREGRAQARRWHEEGKRWHIHMLTPDCAFNQRHDQHAFVLENSTDGETLVIYSDQPQVDLDHELLLLLHGNDILDKRRAAACSSGEGLEAILRRAEDLNEQDLPWHHHIFFPDCVFNEHRGKWAIVFEDGTIDQIQELVYDDEPVDDLRRIEILFFEQACPDVIVGD